MFIIGQYALIATALNSLRAQLDDGFELPAWAEGAVSSRSKLDRRG